MAELLVAAAAAVPEAEGEEADKAIQLSFREHLWDRFELCKARVAQSRRQLEVFRACLRERAQLERQYGKGLALSVSRLQAGCRGASMPVAMDTIVCNMQHRADHSIELADQIESEVVEPVFAALEQHAKVFNTIMADQQQVTRQWQDATRKHEQVSRRYAQACAGADEAARECLDGLPVRPWEWNVLGTRSAMLALQALTVEREYYETVQRLNTATEDHERQMGRVLTALQQMEEKRSNLLRDVAMKIAVFDTSCLRSMQYDLDSAVKVVEAGDPTADLQEFIRHHQSQRVLPVKSDPQHFWELATGPLALTAPARATTTTKDREEVAHRAVAIQPLLRPLLVSAAQADGGAQPGPEEDERALAEFCRDLGGTAACRNGSGTRPEVAEGAAAARASDRDAGHGAKKSTAACRAAFCLALRKEIQASCPPGQQLPVIIKPAALATIVELFTAALDGCFEESDAWNGQHLLVLTQSIRSVEDGRPVDVLMRVYSHRFWASVTFWEEMLLMGIIEAQSHQVLSRWSLAAGAAREQAVMTDFLEQYVSYMVALGIKLGDALTCVERTLSQAVQHIGRPAAEGYLQTLARADHANASDRSTAQVAPAADLGSGEDFGGDAGI